MFFFQGSSGLFILDVIKVFYLCLLVSFANISDYLCSRDWLLCISAHRNELCIVFLIFLHASFSTLHNVQLSISAGVNLAAFVKLHDVTIHHAP